MKIVKCKIPPSYKSATSPANFHTVVIIFGAEASDSLGLRPPYDQIYWWKCFRCPALNGTDSMDRHLAALLQGLSFKHFYTSTAKTVNMLNTVANTNRQTTQVLPPSQHSTDIPDGIERRSRDTRQMRGGLANPLYDLTAPTAPLLTSTTATVSAPTTLPRGSTVNPSASTSPRTSLPDQPSQASSAGTGPAQTDAQPSPGQSCPGELSSNQSRDVGSLDAVSAPDFSSETQENDENNNNDDDFTDMNISSPPNQSSTSFSPSQDQSRPNLRDSFSSASLGLMQPPTDLLSDPNGIYPLPGASQQTGEFSQHHLQQHGLLNDGNICSLISLVLSLHRLGIKEHLIDPHFCFSLNQTPDFSAWILMKVLTALPSPHAFSLQLLIVLESLQQALNNSSWVC